MDMDPQLKPDEVDLPVDHHDLSCILRRTGKVLHDELEQVASRTQFVLNCMLYSKSALPFAPGTM